MTRNDLSNFFNLNNRKKHNEVDDLFFEAMQYSAVGDAVMCAEAMENAARIITETLEQDKAHKRTSNEIERFVADVSAISMSRGGLWD